MKKIFRYSLKYHYFFRRVYNFMLNLNKYLINMQYI